MPPVFPYPGKPRSRTAKGMTLMEVVIAIGIVAFVIPLILAATGSAGSSRLNAEADTRSAWLSREVQREIILSWSENPTKSAFASALAFPAFATSASPEILLYDSDGKFLQKGSTNDLQNPSQIPKASYIAAVHGEQYTAPGSATPNLSILRIRILHPAKATPASRGSYRYNLITSKPGIL